MSDVTLTAEEFNLITQALYRYKEMVRGSRQLLAATPASWITHERSIDALSAEIRTAETIEHKLCKLVGG